MEPLTVQETAQMLKVTPTTVRRYITAGRLPAVKVGRGVRVHTEAVIDLLSPIAPKRPGAPDQAKGGRLPEIEGMTVPPLTEEETQAVLVAIEQSKRERADLAAKYRAVPVPPSLELLDEAREQRTRELS